MDFIIRLPLFSLVVLSIFLLKNPAAGNPVCYSRQQLDDRNIVVRKVACEGPEDTLYKKFPSEESVNILDLIEVTCSFDEFPEVLNGTFKSSDCTGRYINDTCAFTCYHGYHPSSRDVQTTCYEKDNGKAAWSLGSYSCHDFNCSFDELPNVTHGSMQSSHCSGNSGGDVCNVTCDAGYYLTSQTQTVCEYDDGDEGRWNYQGNLSCYGPTCSFSDLPRVVDGFFDVYACSGNSEGDVCNVTCGEGYYPSLPDLTVCQNVGTVVGEWSQADFSCIEKCQTTLGGSNYYWVTSKMTWDAADVNCRSVSSHLVYINDAEENSFVQNLINCRDLPSGSYASIGLINGTADDNIRLADGYDNSEGRVEVFYNGQWGTVCDDDWGITDGHVVCRQLGYKSAYSVYQEAYFGQGTGDILMDNVNCQGNELSLFDCKYTGIDSHNCGHDEDAGVKCASGNMWMWQDGSEASFTNWNPSLSGNYAGCVGIDNNGLWNIYPCESLNYFICEEEPS